MSQTIIHGIVKDDGTILNGSGFKVTHDQKGLYTVFFNTAFNDTPSVVATQVHPNDINSYGSDTFDNAVIVGIATDRFRVKTGNSQNYGEASDRVFSFVAVGDVG